MTIKQAKRILNSITITFLAIVALVLAFNCVYTLQEQEQAVVITLGKPSIVTTPGVHVKVPFIQDVRKVSMLIDGFSIGYRDSFTSDYSESLMITSDYNFVNVDFFLEYRVSDPERYLFASSDPEGILRSLALSYIRDTIGLHDVDEVITTGKNEIQAEIKEKLSNRLDEEDIGLQLVNITIQDSEPPTAEVIAAFKNVETAKQGMETAINNARQYQSEQLPAARAQEDAVLRSAEAQKEVRINQALAEIAVFSAMYEEYQKNPYMTRQRMFYEAMEDILPELKIVIDSGQGGTSMMLPLDSFAQSYSAGNSGASPSIPPVTSSSAAQASEEEEG